MRINKKIKAVAFLLLTLFVLVGCDPIDLVSKRLPEENDKLAREFLTVLGDGDIDGAIALFNKNEEITDEVRELFVKLSKDLSADKLLEVKLIRFANVKAMINDNMRSQFTYELVYENSWAVANIGVDFYDGERYVLGAYIEPLTMSLSEINTFTFEGKSYLHYMMLIFAILFPIVSILAFILCLITKTHVERLGWAVFILAGIGNISINWTSGQVTYNIISMTSVWAPGFRDGAGGAYYISYAIPIGALLFFYLFLKGKRGKHGEGPSRLSS